MTDVSIDLSAYLARIGYNGSLETSLETLKSLHLLHPQAVAFENLDPFLGRPVDLDANSLQRKLVNGRRGGYCFEQNLLFMHVLMTLGFAVTGLAARVLWGRPEGAITKRSHMLLRIEFDSRTYLADVGFGAFTQTGPLLLIPGLEQETPHEAFRIIESGDQFTIQANAGGSWRTLYRFDLSQEHDVDYAVINYYLSTSPASQFVNTLMVARPLPDRRCTLHDNRLSTYFVEGRSEHKEITTVEDLATTLESVFEIAIPDHDAFEANVQKKNVLKA